LEKGWLVSFGDGQGRLSSQSLSGISFVMPVLNEEKYLKASVESIFSQFDDLDASKFGQIEVILALGPSTDATNLVADELASRLAVKIVENPTGKTAAGLNLAIAAAKGDVIVRVDAHSELSPKYAARAFELLLETGAANVGGVMRAEGTTPFSKAVAFGYGSRFGLGGGTFHVGGSAGPSDSVYLGVFRRSVLGEVGGFGEKIIRGQDWELNLRIREAGHVVWFDPRLEVGYRPRSSWRALAKQFYDTGFWRAAITRKSFARANLRYFAPPAMVIGTVLGLAFAALTGTVIGVIPAALYLGFVALATVSAKNLDLRSRLNLLVVLPTMHFAWGIGFIVGLFG
jgi:succinoglycan biosynthesis protein ExoA